MANLIKCTFCDTRKTFDGRHGACAAGWTFVDITAKQMVRYLAICPDCKPALTWLAKATDARKG